MHKHFVNGGTMTNKNAASNKTVTIPQELQQPLSNTFLHTPKPSERYSIVREQGSGGIGRVLVAFDSVIGREIALKELKTSEKKEINTIPPLDAAPSAAEIRFIREAKVTGQLEHPSIIPVYEIGKKQNNTPFYTMRLVQGKTLSEAIAHAESAEKRLRLLPHFRDICNAVAYAHSRGVVHRDIKPENIMIGKFGETVVLDWGLAKVPGENDDQAVAMNQQLSMMKESSGLQTLAGKAMGTPAYMSPEQAKGNIDDIDEKSDIYALGAVLYEILTGTPPFEGDNAQKIIERVIKETPVPVENLEPQTPPELCAIVAHTLAKEKSGRYASSQEVAEEIENYMSGGKVAIYEYSSRELFSRFLQRNTYLSGAIVAIIAILIVASFLLFGLYREALDNEKEANLNLSLGYQEYADRLLLEKKWDKSAIFSAASLYHNPYSPDSPWGFSKPTLSLKERHQKLVDSVSSWFVASHSWTHALQHSIPVKDGSIYSIAPITSSLVAIAGENRVISVIDLFNNKEIMHLKGHKDRITTIDYASDKELLASSSLDGTVRLWDMRKQGEVFSVINGTKEIFSVALNPRKSLVAYGGANKIVTLWNYQKHTSLPIAPGHTSIVRAVAWSKNGEMLASADQKGFIALFDGSKVTHFFRGHTEAAVSLSFSPNGKILASAGYDKMVNIWDVRSGRLITSFRYWDAFYSVKFSPDGSLVVASSRDGTVQLFNLATQKRNEIRTHFGAIRTIAFSNAGKSLITAGEGNRIEVWKTNFSRAIKVFHGHSTYIPAVALSSNGKLMLSSGWDNNIILWNAENEEILHRFTDHHPVTHTLLFSHDDTQFIMADMSGWIRIYDTRNGKLLIEKQGHTSAINKLVVSPNGRLLATAGKNGTVRLWDFRTLTMSGMFQEHSGSVESLAFSPDGETIASVDRENGILLWNVKSGKKIRQLSCGEIPVKDIAWSKKGFLVMLDESDVVRIWSKTQDKIILSFQGPQDAQKLVFSPSGDFIAVIGQESYIHYTESGAPFLHIKHSFNGYAVAFSSDENFFAISSGAIVKKYPFKTDIWWKNPKELLEEAESEAGLNLSGFTLEATTVPLKHNHKK